MSHGNLKPYHFTTGVPVEVLHGSQRRFLRDFLYMGQNRGCTVPLEVPEGSNPYPIVCIINGCGESGKDTFVEMVRSASSKPVVNLSAITATDEICKLMVGTTAYSFMSSRESERIMEEHVAQKSQEYRKFLSQVKAAWNEFNLGPDLLAVHDIERTCCKMADNLPAIIFLHVREPESIRRITDWLETSVRLITMAILIDGRRDPNSFDNESDRNVTNYNYTLTIHNSRGLDMLPDHAKWFATTVDQLNRIHGLQCK